MSVLARIRVFHPEPDPAPSAPVAAEGPELGDDDLEQVVGGLERIYVPGRVVATDF
jgi:hypothetical protein